MDNLEPIDYMANKYAHGVADGGVKYMFGSEDWLAFKDAVRTWHKQEVERIIGKDEALKTDGLLHGAKVIRNELRAEQRKELNNG